ncbi:MAG: hypothetical protein Q8O92_10085 [Candidatus Latescibacter sp.]|nr:hypothetical protein [Candidatus Latescibacter sp.]
MASIYHQLGFRYNWSLDSIESDHTGEGIICAPRYMTRSRVQSIKADLRSRSIFDPQFYLPHSSRGGLATYPFFPQVVAGGFTTADWSHDMALECADACIKFQDDYGFSAITVPTRFREGMPSEFIGEQEELFITPFLEIASRRHITRPLFLQLIVTDFMIRDNLYRTQLLNWITSFTELKGIYLIYHVHNRQKQLSDTEFLLDLMGFIRDIKLANLNVIVGYTNTEGILLTCAGVDGITMGIYENLRMFSPDAFREPDETRRYAPNVRLYIPRLMQWVEYQYLGAIRRVVSNINEYIEDNHYRVSMFQPEYNWHFAKPEPYKHFFIAYSNQLRRLLDVPEADRCAVVLEECHSALDEHQHLKNSGVVFDQESSGFHLTSWISILNIWMRDIR